MDTKEGKTKGRSMGDVKVENIYIKNFRAIEEAHISLKNLSMLIGNNGTGKTSILEAIYFVLSPYYLSGRIHYTDFFDGSDEPIIIELEFSDIFTISIPDGYTEQSVQCKKIQLEIKKRERATPGKSFSDGFVISHWYVPVSPKTNDSGWEQPRKSSGSKFQYTERSLSLNYAKADIETRSFYFNKNRAIQLKKGYNSSITSLFDDFNWRFSNNLKKNEDSFLSNKNNLESQILSKVEDKTIKKSLQALNEKLNLFSLNNIDISFIESQAPFNSAFLSSAISGLDLNVDNLGSGIEMIISLLYLETMASLSKENIVLIIDEPELHLHPSLQEKFIQYLKLISNEKQIILSTHSPYFYKNCCSDNNIKLLITETKDNKCQIKDSGIQLRTFSWSPSWGEINYFAYDLPTIEFHNELYGELQEKADIYKQNDFDDYLYQQGFQLSKTWIKLNQNGSTESLQVTLSTYIRNFIHHPENKSNTKFTDDELKQSISQMINLIGRI
jgi:predicted ATP-dependent endonuclease of OLD family